MQTFRSDLIGGLHQLPPVALPTSFFSDTTTPRIPQGLWTHPSLPILYVGVPLVNKLAIYRFNYAGDLTFLRSVPNEGSTICCLRTNKWGTRLYSTRNRSNTVGVYDTTDAVNPIEIQEFQLSGIGNAFQLGLSKDGHNLYVLSSRAAPSIPAGEANVLHMLAIDKDGTLSEPFPVIPFTSSTGVRPRVIATVYVK